MVVPPIDKRYGWLVMPLAGAVTGSFILALARLGGDNVVVLANAMLLIYDASAVGCGWIMQNVGQSRICSPS